MEKFKEEDRSPRRARLPRERRPNNKPPIEEEAMTLEEQRDFDDVLNQHAEWERGGGFG